MCTPADSFQAYGEMTSDGAGGAIVTWWDARGAADHDLFDIYGQRISPAGEFLWDEAGVLLVSPGEAISNTSYSVCEDGDGGAYITWCEVDAGTPEPGNIYLQRIDGDGNAIWDQNIPVCVVPGQQQEPGVVLRTGGGCYVVWNDWRFSISSGLTAQRLDPQGEALWQANGIYLGVSSGVGDFGLLSDQRGGFLLRSKNHVLRINQDGQILWNHPASTSISMFGYISDFALSPTGRIYVVFADIPTNWYNFDLHGQCFDLQGNYLWRMQEGAILAYLKDSDQCWGYLALTSNGFITAFMDERDYAYTQQDVYFQRVDSTGHVFQGASGAPLYISSVEDVPVTIVPDGEDGAIAFWEKDLYYGGIYANRILEDGSLGNPPILPTDIPAGGSIQSLTGGLVSYSLQQAGNVQVELYDLLGRLIRRYEEGYRQPGNYTLRLSEANLPSGVYLVRLKAGASQYAAKITLLK